MIQIRSSIFETNSSSVHAICISRKEPSSFPREVHFHTDEFGWCRGLADPADYIYSAALQLEREDFLQYMKDVLESRGVKCVFHKSDDDWHYYIDHGGELTELIHCLYNNEDLLLRYLFSKESFIETGNDNDDCCPNYCSPYIYDWDSDLRPAPRIPNPMHKPNDFEYFEKGN